MHPWLQTQVLMFKYHLRWATGFQISGPFHTFYRVYSHTMLLLNNSLVISPVVRGNTLILQKSKPHIHREWNLKWSLNRQLNTPSYCCLSSERKKCLGTGVRLWRSEDWSELCYQLSSWIQKCISWKTLPLQTLALDSTLLCARGKL